MPRQTPYLCYAISLAITLLFLKFYFSDSWTDWMESDQDKKDIKTVHLKKADKKEIFETWHSCFSANMLKIEDPEEFWKSFSSVTEKCDFEARILKMGIVTLENSDEKKRILLPKIAIDPHNLFTIGIGRDIRAEKQFKRKMAKLGNTVEFYGADPMTYVNEDLFKQIGTFFPFAVGAKTGYSNARIMEKYGYVETDVVHISISYFFKEILKIPKIDNLWFDAEGEEFNGIFEVFYRNGPFLSGGIDLCQVNLEVHISSDVLNRKRRFMEFVKKIVEERQFGIHFGDEYGHIRLFLFNYANSYCDRKC